MGALGIEIGTKDGLITDNKKLDKLLTQYALKHSYEEFDGGHADKFSERVRVGLIPFMAKESRDQVRFGEGGCNRPPPP